MIEQVEDPAAYTRGDASPVKGQPDTAGNLEVERRKPRETIHVAGTDECAVLVFDRIRKSGVQVVDRNDGELSFSTLCHNLKRAATWNSRYESEPLFVGDA